VTTTLTAGLERLDAIATERGLEMQADAPLAPLTTLRVGGPADRLAAPESVDGLVSLVEAALDAAVPYFILGKGSDLVVADRGIPGLVIRPRADGVVVDGTRLRAAAGASMTGLAKRCAREALAGFDWAISIPGSFGGAIWANAGAHEGEMAQVVAEVEVFDPTDRGRKRLTADDCGFAYRDSRFKHGGEVFLGGEVALTAGDPPEISALADQHQRQREVLEQVNCVLGLDKCLLHDTNVGQVERSPGQVAARRHRF